MAYRAIAVAHRLVSLSFGLILMLGASGCVLGPPVQEMSNARQAIKAAVDAGAANGAAAQDLGEAQQLMERAQSRFEDQAYREARDSARAAHDKAIRALSVVQASAAITPATQPMR